jgi:hypothetical protein
MIAISTSSWYHIFRAGTTQSAIFGRVWQIQFVNIASTPAPAIVISKKA